MGFPTEYKFGCLSCLNANHYWNKKNQSLTVRCVWARIPVAPFSPQISLYFILSSLQKGVIRHISGLELRRTEHVVDRGAYILCACVCAQLLSHVWLCNSMDCSPPGSSVHGILQARIREWVAIYDSKGSSPPRDRTHASCVSSICKWIIYHWATKEALTYCRCLISGWPKSLFGFFIASHGPLWPLQYL